MKNRILLSLITSIIFYLALSFVYWDLAIFEKIPDLKNEERCLILYCFFIKIIIEQFLYFLIKNK